MNVAVFTMDVAIRKVMNWRSMSQDYAAAADGPASRAFWEGSIKAANEIKKTLDGELIRIVADENSDPDFLKNVGRAVRHRSAGYFDDCLVTAATEAAVSFLEASNDPTDDEVSAIREADQVTGGDLVALGARLLSNPTSDPRHFKAAYEAGLAARTDYGHRMLPGDRDRMGTLLAILVSETPCVFGVMLERQRDLAPAAIKQQAQVFLDRVVATPKPKAGRQNVEEGGE